jgi:hypothetical protein
MAICGTRQGHLNSAGAQQRSWNVCSRATHVWLAGQLVLHCRPRLL